MDQVAGEPEGGQIEDLTDEVITDAQTDVSRRSIVGRSILITFTGISLYIFAPSLVEVYSSWDEVVTLQPLWLIVIVGFQVGSFACMWYLQRLALRAEGWFGVITSQLAGNAFSRIVPGGAAAGVAMQMRMLTRAGVSTTTAASSLTAVSLITTGIVFALPVLALPAILAGTPVQGPLQVAVLLGLAAFVLLAVLGIWLLRSDGPLVVIGKVVQGVRNRIRRHDEPMVDLPERLLLERGRVRDTLGANSGRALGAAVGRSLLDYLSLLAALAAVGAHPNPSLVLLAFVTAMVLGMIPITPGGLGFVEAGLTAALALAGISAADAVVATAVYRLAAFWLPLPAGLVAYIAFRLRIGTTRETR